MSTIKIYSGQSTVVSMENTGSVTFADVTAFLDSKNISYNDSKFVLYNGKLELTSASTIPAGDQKVMVSASKTKAGGFKSNVLEHLDAIQEQLDAMREEFTQQIEEVKAYSNMPEDDREVFEYMKREQQNNG